MSIEALVVPLMRVRLFQGLNAAHLTRLAKIAERVTYREGQYIVEAGQDGAAAIVVVNGPAESLGTGPDEREFVAPGSVIGEMAMFIEHVYGTTVIARGPVRALRFSRAAMHQLMTDDQPLAEFLVGKISSRLKSVAAELHRIDDLVADQQRSFAEAFDALPPSISLPYDSRPLLTMH